MQVNQDRLKERILKFHNDINQGYATLANYPGDYDSNWWMWFERSRACFHELALLAGIPIDPFLYWQAVHHFAECLNLESTDYKNNEYQSIIDTVELWLNKL